MLGSEVAVRWGVGGLFGLYLPPVTCHAVVNKIKASQKCKFNIKSCIDLSNKVKSNAQKQFHLHPVL